MNGRYVETTEELCLKLRHMKLSGMAEYSGVAEPPIPANGTTTIPVAEAT